MEPPEQWRNNMKSKDVFVLIIVIMLMRLFSLSWMPVIDVSEGRYAQIGKEMVTSGDYVTPQIIINGKLIPFWGKPPLFFWAEAASFKLFGFNEFAARLPGALSGFLLIGLLYYVIRRYHDQQTAAAAALIALTGGALFFTSGLVLLDTTLTLFSAGAWIFYYAFLRETDSRKKYWFSVMVFVCLALGFMVKGPVALAMFGLPIFFWTLLNKRWKSLKHHAWLTGSLLFCVITIPWFIYAEHKTPGFLKYFFINENILRFTSKKYGDLYGQGHKFPYGSSIAFMLIASAPWSLVVIYLALVKSWEKDKKIKIIERIKSFLLQLKISPCMDEKFEFFTVGVLSITIFWCFARQLLVYYLLPATIIFAVWASIYLLKNKVRFNTIALISLIVVSMYAIALGGISMTIGKKRSTQKIIDFIKNDNEISNIVFVRRTPYSAYFYGGKMVVMHPKEKITDSLARLSNCNDTVYVVSDHYKKRFQAASNNEFNVLYHCTGWLVARRKEKSLKKELASLLKTGQDDILTLIDN